MFKAYKKFKNQKIKDVRRELGRAHLIIAMLSFITIVLLVEVSALLTNLNTVFTTVAIVLLALVAAISLAISLTLFSITKK